MKKKIVISVFAVMIVIFSTVVPIDRKVEANPLIPVVGGAGAATYAYVALVLAAGYGISELDEETGQKIVDHATSVYNDFNQTVKDAWNSLADSMTPTTNINYDSMLIDPSWSSGFSNALTAVNIPFMPMTSGYFDYTMDGAEFYRDNYSSTRMFMFTQFDLDIDITDDLAFRNLVYYAPNGYIDELYVRLVIPSGTKAVYLLDDNYVYPAFSFLLDGVAPEQLSTQTIRPYVVAAVYRYYQLYPQIAPPHAVDVPAGSIGLNIPKFPTLETNTDGTPKKLGIPMPWFNPDLGMVADGDLPILDVSNPADAPTLTGEGVGDGSTPGEGSTTIEQFFSQGLIGDPGSIQWDKLKLSASAFTHAFPFSLPWDIGRAFDAVFGNVDPANMPTWTLTVYGNSWSISIPQMLINWFPITRAAILIIFDIALIYSVRKLLGGAS